MNSMTDPPAGVTGGVDTHRDTHMAAALDHLGRLLEVAQFPATAAGYRQLLAWLHGFGPIARIGIEGTGVWGAGLARFLTGQGITVVEVDRPDRQQRRRQGKSDPTDAIAAAWAVLAENATGAPKTADGAVESIRMLRVARTSALKARTQAANQLHAIVVTAPETLRATLRPLTTAALVDHASRMRPGSNLPDPHAAAKHALRALARRWRHLSTEIADLDGHLDDLVAHAAPDGLLELHGVSTDVAPARCWSQLATTPTGCAPMRRSPRSAAPHRSRRPPGRSCDTASTAAATVPPTTRCGASCSCVCAGTNAPATTSHVAPPRARPNARSSAASNATSPARSTASYANPQPPTHTSLPPLDINRSIATPSSTRSRGELRRAPADADRHANASATTLWVNSPPRTFRAPSSLGDSGSDSSASSRGVTAAASARLAVRGYWPGTLVTQ
ncbi:hypothetical protein BH23ACT10_BH23ACT10_23700 [soil metagenome]